jgi:phosphoenolpyruvate carboxylase
LELREALTVWWQIDEVRHVRPMVEDEVRRNLFFVESTVYDTIPEVLDELERCFEVRVGGSELTFGSWAGSDMDGHPEVGAETLARTLTLHRETALQLLRLRVRELARTFSHSGRRAPVSPALEASLERDAAELPTARVLRRANREHDLVVGRLLDITGASSLLGDSARARRSPASPPGCATRADAPGGRVRFRPAVVARTRARRIACPLWIPLSPPPPPRRPASCCSAARCCRSTSACGWRPPP